MRVTFFPFQFNIYVNLQYIHIHLFDVLTWCYLEYNVTVGLLHQGSVFILHMEVQDHTAVATLVSGHHVL